MAFPGKFFQRIKKLLRRGGDTEPPSIRYSNDGRGGYVYYQSAEANFAMYYEFGGGNRVASIDVPGLGDWYRVTGLPVARRDEVLNFIGLQVVKDQTLGGMGSFKIENNWLNIYSSHGR